MNLLSWNCLGLENPRSVNALKEVIRIEKPKIVFLMETNWIENGWKKFVISVVLSKV